MSALHWSQLREMDTSPRNYQYRLANPMEPTRAMLIGTLVHEFVHGEGPYHRPWVIWDGARRGTIWTEFKELNHDKEIYTKAEKDLAFDIADSVLSAWPDDLRIGESEKTIQWKIGDRECEGTPDVAGPEALIDLKVTSAAHPRRIDRHARTMGWHGQMAWYRRGLIENGIDPQRVVLVCVEPTPPFNVSVCDMSTDTLEAGRRMCERLLKRLDECSIADEWPSYGKTLIDIRDDYEEMAL